VPVKSGEILQLFASIRSQVSKHQRLNFPRVQRGMTRSHGEAQNAQESLAVDSQFLLDAFRACADPSDSVYCSAPITSGRRHVAWLTAAGYSFQTIDEASQLQKREHREQVISPNCDHARSVVQRLRATEGKPVIDPTSYPSIPSWTQSQWLAFWSAAIRRYAAKVVFVDDWQYSTGCATEFVVCVEHKIPCFDERGRGIDRNDAVAMIRDAIVEIDRVRGYTGGLQSVLASLLSLNVET
jgi:hypothetical protein